MKEDETSHAGGLAAWKSGYRSLVLGLLGLLLGGIRNGVVVEAFVTTAPAAPRTSVSRSTTLYNTPSDPTGSYFSSLSDTASSFANQTSGRSPTAIKESTFSPSSSTTNNNNGSSSSSSSHHYFNTTNGQADFKNGGKKLQEYDSLKHNNENNMAVTAPEVTHWTEIMSQEWEDTAINPTTNWDAVLTDYDLQQIDFYWDQLMPIVNYLGTESVSKIYQSLCVAYRAHRGQMRKSGEPFIIHPVEVALLLAGLKMDGETVMSGLLHDTVEDTDLTFAQVESLFGHTVRSIVEGETKVSKLPKLAIPDYADEQAENLRQMFVAMTDDYRIIIVKLADRLHNMRTLQHMKPEKQVKISRETLDIFAPLAHRMGIWQFKSELEDTAFMYLYPQEYKRLNRRLRQHQKKFRETLDKSRALLQNRLNTEPTLKQQAAKVEVFGRTKEIYSLWHKMETKKEHNLDHIVDVVALRVIITPQAGEEVEDDQPETDRGVWLCYHVLGLVQHLPGFQAVPTRVKDYISFPKPNGYQGLHTALILNGQTIEVQIRTSMMHRVAETGMASHWAYTDDKRGGSKAEVFNTPWLAAIKEWQNDRISSRDFVDSVRRELLGKRVFVFLRNGKILNLARGATAIDAAFQIHTEVGLNMHGVEINGKPVPLSYELQNGDVVSIQTGEGKPATDWMRYAKSRSTRSKLRSYFRARQKESLREAGEILLLDYLWMHAPLIENASYLEHEFVVPETVEELEKFLPGTSEYTDLDDLLIYIGKHHDRVMIHRVVSQLFGVPKKLLVAAEEDKQSLVPPSVKAAVHERRRSAKYAEKAAAAIHADSGERPAKVPHKHVSSTYSIENMLSGIETAMEYADPEHLCEDCLPIHGDEVVGTRPRNSDSITTVHRMGCPHVQGAINQAVSQQKLQSIQRNGAHVSPRVDSVSLRMYKMDAMHRRNNGNAPVAKYVASTDDVPVRLEWSDMDDVNALFLTEVVVHAEDRKLLLADCSEVVSETVEILKTGSASTKEHATLVFLVRVNCIETLQKLMDQLGQVRSVMSVERRFGSELS